MSEKKPSPDLDKECAHKFVPFKPGLCICEICWQVRPAADESAKPAPKESVRVPLLMTRAMREVVDSEEWQWEDVLAAAEAVTEDEYNAIAQAVEIPGEAAPGTIGIQEAWEVAGGNPGIKATREDLLIALRDLDAVADEVPPKSQGAPVAVGDALSDADLLAIHAGWQDSEDGALGLLRAVRDQTIASTAVGAALRELVRLKDLKDRLERSLLYIGRGSDEQEYARAKPLAWEAARAALASQAAPATTVYDPEFVRNKFADYETQILNLREELAARVSVPDAQQANEHHGLDTPERVCFYEQDFYVLSNFSSFRVLWKDIDFDTSEAAYHWEKFPNAQGVRAAIQGAGSAHDAFKVAERFKASRRADWDDVKVDIMRGILRAKARQHEYVRRKLLATGDRELIENSWRDDFWGWGMNRDGQNMLGKLWMEVRAELRATDAAKGEPT